MAKMVFARSYKHQERTDRLIRFIEGLALYRGPATIFLVKVLVSGSTGLIGSALAVHLTQKGEQVVRLVRAKSTGNSEILWNPVARVLDVKNLGGFDAVVHLAGDPIAKGRWTPEKKASIRDSRIKGTRFLAESLAKLSNPPKAFACASAIGIYGNRADEGLTEESPPGVGFLAEVGKEWEKACEPATTRGIRVVHLRFGIVLSPHGGALKLMLPPFQFGLGGKLGSGMQWMSWVSIDDVVGAIHHVLTNESLRGPVNVVAPNPVTNLEFTKRLGRVLGRPTLFLVPAFAVRLLFGQLADEALLASARVEPKRLKSTGYRFRYPELETALRDLLGR